jgi:hypothetical protein
MQFYYDSPQDQVKIAVEETDTAEFDLVGDNTLMLQALLSQVGKGE